jgi:hypothetical protein
VLAEAMPAQPTVDDRIRAALWFAERGFGVFTVWSAREDGTCRCPAGASCDSPGKHPIADHGFKDATHDPARIRTLLSAGSSPNYGLVCPPGVFAWDVDGEDLARLAQLEARLGALPATLGTQTAHGCHLFLRWPQTLPRPLHRMFGFVTRWGSGDLAGYVVGPRSVHASGVQYAPSGVAEIAALPDVWAQAVLDEQARPSIRVAGRAPADDVRVGGRHDWLRDTARLYAGVVRDPEALFAAVSAENVKLAEPKTEEAVRRAIGDVLARFGPDPVEEDPDTGEVHRVLDDEIGMLAPTTSGAFPTGPDPVAYAGLLGECTLALAEGTDAALVGLLGSLLAFAGALVPGAAYFHRLQTSSPYIALVGESSVGRKGTAMTRVHDAMADALEAVHVNRVVLDGLNSGEALVSALAYKQTAFRYEPTVGLVYEEEYASLLASRGRDGSTLDPKMRAAFDGGPLSNRRSSETKTVAPPYWLPALIGITPVELRLRLEPGALQSGSANRWLYLPVRRRDVEPANTLPLLDAGTKAALREARRQATARQLVLEVDLVVTRTLGDYADFLATTGSGVARDLSRRFAVIAFRIALVHALVERSGLVGRAHLDRALALTEYGRAGLGWVFGGTVGNRDAVILLRSLRKIGSLRKHTITREILRDPLRQQDAIDELVRLGYARVVTVPSERGRPRTELRFVADGEDFRPFVQSSAYPHPSDDESAGRLDETPLPRSDSEGRNPDGSGDETWSRDGRNPLIWSLPCVDYRSHQDFHRQGATGWVCDACHPGGAA